MQVLARRLNAESSNQPAAERDQNGVLSSAEIAQHVEA